MVSEKILQALCDIASTAAYQIGQYPTCTHMLLVFPYYSYSVLTCFLCVYASSVKNESQKFKVWVPSLADLTLVLMNMGAAFVTLFPFENLQPPFTEADLL